MKRDEERTFQVENINLSEEEATSSRVVVGASLLMSILLGLCCTTIFIFL